MNILYLPLEPLPERYSVQWRRWFEDYFQKHKIPYIKIDPPCLSDKILNGSFLDVAATNHYKAKQVSVLSEMFFNNQIKGGDIIFIMDVWHPGLEAIAYMRDGLGIDVKICGCIFAGTYDSYDFTFQKGMGYWGKDLENSWFRILDKIFVATDFHKKLILQNRDCDSKKLVVTGHPMLNEMPKDKFEKENIIAFPHRLDSEKNPQLFDLLEKELKETYPEWRFIKTKEVTKTKKEFYNLLQKSKIAVSFADQETFGFSTIEAAYADCLILVPNKLSYQELYAECFKYSSWHECLSIIINMMENPQFYEEKRIQNKQKLLKIGTEAIPKMIEEMRKL